MYIYVHFAACTRPHRLNWEWLENWRKGENVFGILEEEKYFTHMKLIMLWYVSYYQVVMGRGHIAVAL